MLLAGNRRVEDTEITVQVVKIKHKKTVKYLGVTIDQRMCFTTHIKEVSEKADKLGTALSQIMPNVEVPNACKRRLICSAVESIKLYAAPVWHLALKRESYKQAMLRVHRKAAIRISSAYRTIFNSAVMVIAGTIPIDIKARERVVVFKKEVTKTDARTASLEEWQSRRRIDNTGAWTRRLVPEVKP